ncbi:MAG: triphosphoribosyl-dephospho-CoA synthase [Synergistaceae bacterium]|nr:triphosphoribosyl-dephospho-CoA synthase [Synergistaceae bacterium]
MSSQVKRPFPHILWMAAAEAVADEIVTAPKPGLVDPLGQGCHIDMTWQTFIKSAQAIEPFWKYQTMIGLSGTAPSDALRRLRFIGVAMEKKMFAATSGINTHKGLIFLLSLLLYGSAYCIYSRKEMTPENIVRFASESVQGLTARELGSLSEKTGSENLTNGEKLFLTHGITGVRGEAENGFPSIIKHGLPELRRTFLMGASTNSARIAALLSIMYSSEDSNVIHRGGYDFWKDEYKNMVKETIERFNPLSEDYRPLEDLEKKFLKSRISPGGAADLLCCSIFLDLITKPTCQQ